MIDDRMRDQIQAGIEAALHRAALRARRIAAETGTPLVIYENGRIVKLTVQEDHPAPATDRKPA